MRLSRRVPLRLLFLLLCLLAPPLHSQVSLPSSYPWGDDVREFASKIAAAATPTRSISFSIRNISKIDPAQMSSIAEQLRSEFSRRGLEVVSAEEAGTTCKVTLSERSDGYLWIAE